jgi:hypothetical protein
MTLLSFETSSLLTTGDTYKKSITEFHYYARSKPNSEQAFNVRSPLQGRDYWQGTIKSTW